MINISDANKALWNKSTEKKNLVISFPDDNVTITNVDIVSESLRLEEAINEDNVLTFTGCIASRFSFEIADIVQDLRGHRLTATIQIGDEEDPVPLFYGYIDTQDNLSHQDVVTHFEAYDPFVTRINEVDVTEWYNDLSFPLTVKAFRDSFFLELGLSQREITLPNDGLYLSAKTIDEEAISGGEIIRYICELNGVFGHFDRYGYFEFKQLLPITKGLYPSVDLYPSPDLYPSRENINTDASSIYSAIKYEPFEVEKITGVRIIDSYGTEGGSYGAPDNVWTISDNPLAWAVDMATAAENLAVQVRGMWFVPCEIRAVGLPYIEPGDAIFINTKKNIVRTYILSRTLEGIQAIEDEYRAKSEKKQPLYTESTDTQISRNVDNISENADNIVKTRLYADEIVANEAVRTNQLVAQKIEAEETRTNTLVAQQIQAEATRTNTLVANSIQAEATRTNTLVANSIQTEQIRVNNLLEAEKIRVNNLIADEIQAEVIRTNNLLADKASYNYVNSNFATLNELHSNYITAGQISANYATVGELNAVNAKFNSLNASNITSGTLSAARIDTDTLASQSFQSKTLNCKEVFATSRIYGNIFRGYSITLVKGDNTASETLDYDKLYDLLH